VARPGAAQHAPTDTTALGIAAALLALVALALGVVLFRRRRRSPVRAPQRSSRPVLTLVQSLEPPPDPAATVVVLEVHHGGTVVTLERTEGAFTVGSSVSCEVTLDLPGLAGRHARFERFPGGAVIVTDAHSTTGTWYDGNRLDMGERRLLRAGEQVMLGPEVCAKLIRVGPPVTP
jgi:hypothetical protein